MHNTKQMKDADIVVFGAPFDGTTTYRPGTRFAPAAIRNNFYTLESYSPYQNRDLSEVRVFDTGDIDIPLGNSARAVKAVEKQTQKILDAGKFPLMLGGEHLVTLGSFRAIHKKHPNAVLIHFDAHADLLNECLGEKLGHGMVVRRIHEETNCPIYQFGIRSGDKSEFDYAATNTKMTRFCFSGIENIAKGIGNRPVYLSVDLDVLDPAEFPGTGTPEAGGVTFTQLLNATREIFGLNVVGCDIVELCPPHDASGISTALACKYLREVLLYAKSR